MLCPEVWNFKPPASLFSSESIKNDEKLVKLSRSQHFNHFISIVLPNISNTPERLINLVSDDSIYYRVNNIHAVEFVKKEFIDLFIKKGNVTLLSIGTKLDQDDCLAITPNGKLILSLRRKSYQELGIEGKPTEFNKKHADKYLVILDLTADHFCPGKKNYENILEKFTNRKDLIFNVILTWEPTDEKICPSSIAAYFARNHKVESRKLNHKARHDKNVAVPDFEDKDDVDELMEWLGAFSLNCNIPEEADGYISTYQQPLNSKICDDVIYLEWTGLITINRIERIIEFLRSEIANPWISLNVQGFDDSPVNRGEREHHFYMSGDYHYTIFFKNNTPSLLCSFISSTRKPISAAKKRKKQ